MRATCSNCLNDMPEIGAYEDEFCSQACFDDWMAYQDDCASHVAEWAS